MLADLIRAAVQLVMRDKIVAGIIIVFILGAFFTGVSQKDSGGHRFISNQAKGDGAEGDSEGGEKGQSEGVQGGEAKQGQTAQNQGNAQDQQKDQQKLAANQPGGADKGQSPGQGAGPGPGQAQSQAPGNTPSLDPKLAVEFVRWWLTMSLDYSINSAANHKKALAYASKQVGKIFSESFYTAEVMQGVAHGTLAGSFEPVTVQAVAINPDGSVVVTVIGTLSMQSSGSQPVSQSLIMDFLVQKDSDGVHMMGFFNKTVAQPSAQAAPAPEQQPQSSERPQFEGQ